jgi:hypothetical protein
VKLAEDITALDADLYDQQVTFRRDQRRNPAVPRRDAVSLRVLETLATDPVLTTESASARLDASPAAAHRALTELHDAGILGRSKDQRGKTICWTADRHLALVELTERSNRVGGEDTRNRKPRLGRDVRSCQRSRVLFIAKGRVGHTSGHGMTVAETSDASCALSLLGSRLARYRAGQPLLNPSPERTSTLRSRSRSQAMVPCPVADLGSFFVAGS